MATKTVKRGISITTLIYRLSILILFAFIMTQIVSTKADIKVIMEFFKIVNIKIEKKSDNTKEPNVQEQDASGGDF